MKYLAIILILLSVAVIGQEPPAPIYPIYPRFTTADCQYCESTTVTLLPDGRLQVVRVYVDRCKSYAIYGADDTVRRIEYTYYKAENGKIVEDKDGK